MKRTHEPAIAADLKLLYNFPMRMRSYRFPDAMIAQLGALWQAMGGLPTEAEIVRQAINEKAQRVLGEHYPSGPGAGQARSAGQQWVGSDAGGEHGRRS
jgi:hypothetical protein